MKVLIIGSGAREHCIATMCARSYLKPKINTAPGNGGTTLLGKNFNISPENTEQIIEAIKQQQYDLVIIGPEYPLANGLAEKIRELEVPVFGPDHIGAKIESHKDFAKNLMTKCRVPTVEFAVFTDFAEASNFITNNPNFLVIKANGLAAGKGVHIADDVRDAILFARKMLIDNLYGEAGRKIVVEKKLVGKEISLLAIVDGEDWLLLPPAQDYKRAFDNDKGPNTGGMGAFSPLFTETADWYSDIADRIFPNLLKELKGMGIDYRGCLYAGLMVTEDGVKVLEFNARFGDPETQVILPLLTLDPLEIMFEAAKGNLGNWMQSKSLTSSDWEKISSIDCAVTVVASMKGYPTNFVKGVQITAVPEDNERFTVFHAGTKRVDGTLITNGGRVFSVTGFGETIASARENAYEGIEQIKFEGKTFRTDIALVSKE